MTRALSALLVAGLPLCVAVRAMRRCECDECHRRSSRMAKGAFTAFNRAGIDLIHYCSDCAEDAQSLIPLYGVTFFKPKNTFEVRLTQPREPESQILKRIDLQAQMRKLEEIGHGFPWKRQRRYS